MSDGVSAKDIRVLVRRNLDMTSVASQRAARRRALWIFLALIPSSLVLLVFLIRSAWSVPYLLPAGISAIGFIVLFGLIAFRRMRLRQSEFPDRVWTSDAVSFPGPYDNGDPPGLEGSSRFARKHRRGALDPIVRLVVTPTTIEIWPTAGRRNTLSLPMAEISEIAISPEGVNISLRSSRIAKFLGRAERLEAALTQLGARVTYIG